MFKLLGKRVITILRYFFCLTGPIEMLLPALYICCIYSNVLQTNFITEANTVSPDQMLLSEPSDLGPYCFLYRPKKYIS